MLRVELFVLLGFAIGVPIGALLLHVVQKFLAARDRRIVKVRVSEALDSAPTDQLINELSQRDDLTSQKREKR